MAKTIDPMINRIHFLRSAIYSLLKELERRYRKNSNCLDNLRNYSKKNIFVRIKYYFLNKQKDKNEKLLELKNEELKEILDEIEKLIGKLARRV